MVFLGKRTVIIISIATLLLLMVVLMYGPLSGMTIDHFYAQNLFMQNEISKCVGKGNVSEDVWKGVDLTQRKIPQVLKTKAASVQVTSNSVSIDGIVIHYRIATPVKPKPFNVLFLHGQSFDSMTWQELSTIQLCTAFGFRTIAVDLPGFGISQKASMSFNKDFIANLIEVLDIIRPVIVSPSMSGAFSLPYVIEHWQNVSGFVPISPIGTTLLEKKHCGQKSSTFNTDDLICLSWIKSAQHDYIPDLSCIMLPVMVVCGGRDNKLSSSRLCHLPMSKGVEVPDAAHAAYMSNPTFFHELLYNFLLVLSGC